MVVVHIKDLRHHISVVRVEGELEEGELDQNVTTEKTHSEKDLTKGHDKPKKVAKVPADSDAIVIIDSSPDDTACAASEEQLEYHWKGGSLLTFHLRSSKSQLYKKRLKLRPIHTVRFAIFPLMGPVGAGDIVVMAQCEHLH